MTVVVGARNLFKVDAGVVHALLQNRYMDGSKGTFLSEDPTFLAVGTPKLTEILNRVNGTPNRDGQSALQQFLADPQLMNSYGYARDNPIINKDPTGEVIPLVAILAVYGAAQLSVDAYDAYNMNFRYADVTTPQQKNETRFKFGFDAFTSVIGGSAAKVGLKGYDFALS